jgi:uncharacterized membrane protein
VVALGVKDGHAGISALGAVAALLAVMAAGCAVRAPLRQVPENTVKFLVGAAITAFGTFWTGEAIAGAGAWPFGDWALPVLILFYLAGGSGLAVVLRGHRRASV